VSGQPVHERSRAITFIVCLGMVSLFADMTYEGARSIIGPFLRSLGASAAAVGFIAGFGEMLAAGLRFFTGRLVDRTRAYWTMTIAGYFLTVVAVPLMALAGNWQMAALLIILERTGKSLRGPARDVLLSGATASVGHGWGFGLHTAMDQTGAVLGPLLMVAAVAREANFAPAFVRLALPGAAAMLALIFARFWRPVEVEVTPAPVQRTLPPVFWKYVAAAGLLAFGYLDFALLAYHFQQTSLMAEERIPLLYAVAMGVNGLAALMLGRWFDRLGMAALAGGIVAGAAALPLALLGGNLGAIAGMIAWGIGLGAQDGCLRPAIAKVVSMNKRGAAFGAFSGVFGVAWFLGSATMGLLYEHSIVAVVALGVAAQIGAAALFLTTSSSSSGRP
jgi:predicted MFS family arabinose efflux permease